MHPIPRSCPCLVAKKKCRLPQHLLAACSKQERKSRGMSTNFNDYKTVQTWIAGVHEQSGVSPEHDAKRLQILAEFCGQREKDPDQIIDECLRDVDGGKKIRVKGRRFYAE